MRAGKIDQLIVHVSTPGSMTKPTSDVLNQHVSELAHVGIMVGSLDLCGGPQGMGDVADMIPVLPKPLPKRPRTYVLSAGSLLGRRRAPDDDHHVFHPDATYFLERVIRSLRPAATTVIVESLSPALVLHSDYVEDLRRSEVRPPEHVFDLTQPLVDLADLRRRILDLPTVTSVRFSGITLSGRPDPFGILESHLRSDSPAWGAIRDHLMRRIRPGRARSVLSERFGQNDVTVQQFAEIDGFTWTGRSVAAARSVDRVLNAASGDSSHDGSDDSNGSDQALSSDHPAHPLASPRRRADLLDFIVSTIEEPPDLANGFWSPEQAAQIARAHAGVDLGLFG